MDKKKILAGRKAVKQYRADHAQLKGFGKEIHDAHTPLLNTMLVELKKQGFNSLDKFFNASEELNIKELGFASREDFEAKATQIDRAKLRAKWQ